MCFIFRLSFSKGYCCYRLFDEINIRDTLGCSSRRKVEACSLYQTTPCFPMVHTVRDDRDGMTNGTYKSPRKSYIGIIMKKQHVRDIVHVVEYRLLRHL